MNNCFLRCTNGFIITCLGCAFLLFGLSAELSGQTDDITFVNEKPIDKDRYEDIKGSPYYFDDWVVGDIMRNDAFIFEKVKLNYNGYSKTFEVLNGEKMIELKGGQYLRVDVDLEENPTQAERIVSDDFAFQRNLHPKFGNRFVVILFNHNDYMLIKDFEVDIAKNTVQNPGNKVEFKDFNIKDIYYIKSPAGLEQIKLRRKGVEDFFKDPRVGEYIKANRMKMSTDADLVEIVRFVSELPEN